MSEYEEVIVGYEVCKRYHDSVVIRHAEIIGDIVRCKDCTRYVPFKDVDGVCLAHNTGVLIVMSQNGYCNLGERKEDA